MCSHVNKDWYYIDYIKKGIGIHHGNTPLFLRKFIEDEYANGNIHTILCTSTLVEGINTPTDQLIIYDTPRTTFELNNLIGRVGRLNVNSPKKGRVYFTNDETNEMYQPDDWIDLNILYEETDILSKQSEDEYPDCFELRANQVDKATAVKKIMVAHAFETTYCFGDGTNDIDMLKLADVGVAMGNACDALKEVSDVVIGRVDEDGIYNFLMGK